ncbi:MAG: hypothetical protein CL678_09765 [Bdellovibrionaceae bacterium]|nr:hypothetical protein [Pseudobdellovibrionaceae bacterium]
MFHIWKIKRTVKFLLLLVLSSVVLFSCKEEDEVETLESRVNSLINIGDCQSAANLIEPYYQSQQSNNKIRRLRASAQGCLAGIEFFSLAFEMSSIGSSCNGVTCTGLWSKIAELFDGYENITHLYAGWYTMDSCMAQLTLPSTLVPSSNLVSDGAYNSLSLDPDDRTQESNLYLFMGSMASIGSALNRNGNPNPDQDYAQRTDLPWTTAAAIEGSLEGCATAGAILNMSDALSNFPSSVFGTALDGATEALETLLTAACGQGCLACGQVATNCIPCPTALRHRGTECDDGDDTNVATDNVRACAAAGIIDFLNTNWTDSI